MMKITRTAAVVREGVNVPFSDDTEMTLYIDGDGLHIRVDGDEIIVEPRSLREDIDHLIEDYNR